MWLAYVLLCRDIELACDEKVIKELGNEQRADYTQALVVCSVNRRMIAACPLAFGEVGVKERVKSVMNYKKPAFWVVVLAVIACIVVAVCFLTDPVGFQFDEATHTIVSTNHFDMRNTGDAVAVEMNSAQISELSSRLAGVKNTKKSGEYGGFTPGYSLYSNYGYDVEQIGTVEATIRLADELTQPDTYYYADLLISLAFAMRFWVYAIGIGAAILAIAAFVFLMCASGRKNGLPTAQPGWGTKIPFDLLTGVTALAGFLLIEVMVETSYYGSDIEAVLAFSVLGIALMVICLDWCMSFATRIKLGCWWKNTIIFYCLKIFLIVLRKIWRGICVCFRGMVSLCRGIPLVWKTALGLAAICSLFNILKNKKFLRFDFDFTSLVFLISHGNPKMITVPRKSKQKQLSERRH